MEAKWSKKKKTKRHKQRTTNKTSEEEEERWLAEEPMEANSSLQVRYTVHNVTDRNTKQRNVSGPTRNVIFSLKCSKQGSFLHNFCIILCVYGPNVEDTCI